MALDEVLTRRAGQGLSPPTLRFLRFSPDAVLLGYHQEADRELRLDYCAAEGIEVNRRLTGGGALLFQSSALGWELIAPLGAGPFRGGFDAALTRICRAAARALGRLGLEAVFRPRNDIEVYGRKVSGTGGMVLEGGALFQGTVLVVNEIERFLKALRVPVEKLKKREIKSLMQRMAFLEDLLGYEIDLAELKRAIAQEFSESLGLNLVPGGLTPGERRDLSRRLPFFCSEQWLQLKRPTSGWPDWLKSVTQTDGGTLRVHLWLDRRRARVQKALISGDFFSQTQRLVMDLEAALVGTRAAPAELARRVREFLEGAPGGLSGIRSEEVVQAVTVAAARRDLATVFSPQEAADLFLAGLQPAQVGVLPAGWLLLPYCAKPLDCAWRDRPGCGLCGGCDLHVMHELACELGIEPVTIQSFEHLLAVLGRVAASGRAYVGSCCEAFYCKHQREMEQCGARGVLVNLDSTTCYDLGKGMEAYAGRYDQQTSLNLVLMEKVARVMAQPAAPARAEPYA
jgi:lipoate-protein ligase A